MSNSIATPAAGLKPVALAKLEFVRQHDMTYWYFWGGYSVDIRDIRAKLDLGCEDEILDNQFRFGYTAQGRQKALRLVAGQIRSAMRKQNKKFSDLVS